MTSKLPGLGRPLSASSVAAFMVATLLLAGSSQGDGPAKDFPALLDQLEKSETPLERGFDQMPQAFDHPGNRVVQMLGSPQTWDAFGTPALRQAVLARWRKRWAAEGEAMLRGLRSPGSMSGRVEAQAGDLRVVRDIGSMRHQFFLNNARIYEMGEMDGTFSPAGFMLGDQAGVWVPPLKALDGFAFVFREQGKDSWRLEDCQHFTHDFASGTFHYARSGWSLSRTDYPAVDLPALFSRLTLTNQTADARAIEVDFIADVNIRPDWRTKAHNNLQNDLDVIEARDGLVRAWDRNLPRSMIVVGADQGATQTQVNDARATLTYQLKVPAGASAALTCLIQAGLELDDRAWADGFQKLASRSVTRFDGRKQHVAAQRQNGVQFRCSDARLTEAFALAKENVGLLTADCRPHFRDVYLMAGVPVYPRLFACDSCVSLPGVTAAGLWSEARGTLTCLAAQARKHGFLVPHESATDATFIGPANSQETTQFIAICATYLRWTADRKLAADLYPVLTEALAAHCKRFAPEGYPAGPALIETRGTGARKIDAACWQHAALAALAEVAQALGNKDDAKQWRGEATRLRTSIQRDWWIPKDKMWADSLDAKGQPQLDGLWSVVFPLLTNVASAEQAALTLDGLEFGWVNQWGGVHTRQANIRQQGSGVVTTGVFAEAALAHRRPDWGLHLMLLNAEAPRQDRMPGGFTEMIPPGGSDFVQLWSVGPFLEAVVEGLAGIRPNAFADQVEIAPQLPASLEWFTLDKVRIGEHELRIDVRRVQTKIVTKVTHVNGPAPLSVTFIPLNQAADTQLDGKKVAQIDQWIDRLDCEMRVIPHSLTAESKVTFAQ